MDLELLLGKIGISLALTQDISLLLVVIVFSLVFGMFIGRYRLITVLISIYVAFALTQAVPGKYFTEYLYELVFFLASVIVLTLAGKQLLGISTSGSGTAFLWRVFVMSFLEAGLLLSIALSIVPKKVALGFVSSNALGYLTAGNASLFWMIVPLVFLFFVYERLKH